jgi:hypothetical protein
MSLGRGALALLALTAFTPTVHAAELDIPARKAGEWEIVMSLAGKTKMPAMTMRMCLDAKTDAEMMKAGLSLSKDRCSRQEMSRDGDTITIDSACSFGPMKTTSHIVVSGDFQSAYTVKVASSIEGGPAAMPKKSEMTQTARWLGATCDGLKPGEMTMPNGMKIDATKAFGPGGG